MVQQLSLWATMADAEHGIVLKMLGTICGMNPRLLNSQVQVWEPKYPFTPVLAAGQVNQIEQYRIFCHSDGTIFVYEVPEPGRNLRVILQTVLSAQVKDGNVVNFLESLGYEYRSEYSTKGYEFVLGNVVVHMLQVESAGTSDWIMKVFVEVAAVTDLPAIEKAQKELEGIQQDFRGLVTLLEPSRGAFNTRVKAR